MTITFFASGDPKGQPRPRAFSRGGHARVYDPGTAERWKGAIALAASWSVPESPITTPVSIRLDFFFARPGRLKTKKAMALTDIPHTAKPDCDNCAKAVMDCLTQIGMWSDDAQVCQLVVTKKYTDDGRPGALIRINEIIPT